MLIALNLKRLVHGSFNDVAAKYLNNYAVYYSFVNFINGRFTDKRNILTEFVFSTDAYTKSKEIRGRDLISVLRNEA
ncbi:hypothetical protein CXU06_11510 [Akkermansia muciniphila]|jgi:hypothetical protein|nr:hypothetical protein CXU06_11510 [Akkermansia muciniphila]